MDKAITSIRKFFPITYFFNSLNSFEEEEQSIYYYIFIYRKLIIGTINLNYIYMI